MRVEWLPDAVSGLQEQLNWIAEHDPWAAVTVGDAVLAAADRLGQYPGIGREGRVPGTRELVVTGTPFVVVYRLEPNSVLVLRVLHGAQRWPPA